MPLVWASRLQGTPLPDRVTGASLIETLTAAAAEHGHAVYLVGGEAGVADAAVDNLLGRYPGLRAVGWSPPFGVQQSPAGLDRIRDDIRRSDAAIVFCGFGFPKQEALIAELIGDFPDVWFVGCGAAITFAAGRIARAPLWMQRAGIEWVHRLASEPRRMFRRYVLEGVPFAIRLLIGSAASRLSGRGGDQRLLLDLARVPVDHGDDQH